MTSFKKYFFYHFKTTLLRGAVLAIIFIALTASIISPSVRYRGTDIYIYSDIGFLGIASAVICTIIPILELMAFKNRRNLDTLFFLPVSRPKMALAHYINGLIQIIAVVTLCFVTALVRLMPLAKHLNLIYLLPLYGLHVLICLMMYSVFMFIFTQANTVADGVVFMVVYMIVGFYVVTALGEVTGIKFIEKSPEYYFIYSPISVVTSEFNAYITPTIRNVYDGTTYGTLLYTVQSNYTITFDTYQIVSFIFWGIAGLASVFGYIFTFARQKAENVGGISQTWFGYRTLIPLCAVCMMTLAEFDSLTGVVTAVAMAIAYIVYRRTFKLKMLDVAIILAVFLVAVGGAIF